MSDPLLETAKNWPDELVKERDELRAQVKRLQVQADAAWDCNKAASIERDEARAEVERLRAALRGLADELNKNQTEMNEVFMETGSHQEEATVGLGMLRIAERMALAALDPPSDKQSD